LNILHEHGDDDDDFLLKSPINQETPS